MPDPQKSEVHEVTDDASTSPAQQKVESDPEKDHPELHVDLDENKHDEDFGGPLKIDLPGTTGPGDKK